LDSDFTSILAGIASNPIAYSIFFFLFSIGAAAILPLPEELG
jgi:hypothetical protein